MYKLKLYARVWCHNLLILHSTILFLKSFILLVCSRLVYHDQYHIDSPFYIHVCHFSELPGITDNDCGVTVYFFVLFLCMFNLFE